MARSELSELKRLFLPAVFAAALALLTMPGSALAANARAISPTTLAFPAAFTVAPDGGRILYGELSTGRIVRLNVATGARTPLFTIPNVRELLGVALSPNYPSDGGLWAFATRTVSGTPRNQLLRIREDRTGFAVLRSFPAGLHNGGRIMFGPDGKLYVVLGENGIPSRAQRLDILAGKMLRLNPDGTVPSANPRAGSPVIAYGIRNSFGFTFDPETGRLWETDNGPECNDEINLVPRLTLTNFGWGSSGTCSSPPPAPRNTNQDGPNPVLPEALLRHPAGADRGRVLQPVRTLEQRPALLRRLQHGDDPPCHADLRTHGHRLAGTVL